MFLRKARILASTLTTTKLVNAYRLWASFHQSRRLGRPLHRGLPAKLGFEPTTHCNLRCPECPSGLRSFTRPTGMANTGIFESVIDELSPTLIYLLLYFQGEPFLNPRFLEMARYASQKGMYVATSTNAHYLSPDKADETIKSGISEVIISIDGASQETYQAYRVGGKLEKVLEGTRNLVAARKAANTLRPLILWQFLVVRTNEHEIDQIRQMGREAGVDGVLFKTAQIYDFENGHPLIPENERYRRYHPDSNGRWRIKNPLENQCWRMWQGAEVTWDGRVLPCCFDKDGQYQMGQLGETRFADIWRSDHYDAFRAQLLKGRDQIDICRNCSEGTQIWG